MLTNTLYSLNSEIIENEISPHFNENDLANIITVSKEGNTFFKTPYLAAKLLHYVRAADYDEVKKIIKDKLASIFQHVSYKKIDGSYEIISPLKYAFKVYDTYMWMIFKEAVKNRPELENLFVKQAEEQKEHVCLKPLYDAYNNYLLNHNELLKIGMMQRDILPRHMLKEFCRDGTLWQISEKFNASKITYPSNCRITSFNREIETTSTNESITDISISTTHINFPIKNKIDQLILTRGSAELTCIACKAPYKNQQAFENDMLEDTVILGQLFQTRENDFNSLLKDLKLSNSTAQDNMSKEIIPSFCIP